MAIDADSIRASHLEQLDMMPMGDLVQAAVSKRASLNPFDEVLKGRFSSEMKDLWNDIQPGVCGDVTVDIDVNGRVTMLGRFNITLGSGPEQLRCRDIFRDFLSNSSWNGTETHFQTLFNDAVRTRSGLMTVDSHVQDGNFQVSFDLKDYLAAERVKGGFTAVERPSGSPEVKILRGLVVDAVTESSVVDEVELELRQLLVKGKGFGAEAVKGRAEDLSKASVERLIARMRDSKSDVDRCHELLRDKAEAFLESKIGLSSDGKWLGRGTVFKIVEGGLEVSNVMSMQYGKDASSVYGKELIDLFKAAGIAYKQDGEAGDVKFVIPLVDIQK